MNTRKPMGRGLLAVALLALLALMLYSGLQILERTVLHRDAQDETIVSKTITRNGVDYFPRQDITTVLVMGIDQYGPVEASEGYTNPGAADMNLVVIFDERDKTCNLLYLNRDTMLDMPVLGVGGRKAGTYYGQLALAHTYGTGLDDSCENTREAVSAFLKGIKIDYYVSMNMDAISILNDAVGGVKVNVTDDFSQIDSTMRMGRMTLRGEQAIHYVRTRKDVGDQLNLSRIQRQKEYIDSFSQTFLEKQESDSQFVVSLYDQVSAYLVTDCSVNTLSGMMERYGDYTLGKVMEPQGENVMGETYYEFYADEARLDELVLELFFAPKE